MANHSTHDGSSFATDQVVGGDSETAAHAPMCGNGLSSARQGGDAWARAHVERALKVAGVSDATIADRLGISKTRAEQLRTGRAAYHLGDVSRMPRSVAVPLLRAMLADLEAAAPVATLPISRRTLRISTHTGELARAVDEATADGVIDDRERVVIARASRAVATEATCLERETLVPELVR